MKIELTLGIVKSLRLDDKPTGLNAKKTLITETNVGRARYILWDAHQKAPPGFGVRVAYFSYRIDLPAKPIWRGTRALPTSKTVVIGICVATPSRYVARRPRATRFNYFDGPFLQPVGGRWLPPSPL